MHSHFKQRVLFIWLVTVTALSSRGAPANAGTPNKKKTAGGKAKAVAEPEPEKDDGLAVLLLKGHTDAVCM